MTQLKRANLNNIAQAKYRQRGIGMYSLMAIAGVAIFVALVAFKVGPSYAEYWTVSRVADDVAANTGLLKGPKSKVYQSIAQGFKQNNLWDAEPKEMIRLEKDARAGMIVHVDYESRTNLFGNVYVVTKFQREAGNGGL